VTAFHQDYKMTDPRDTSAADLLRAAAIGRESGLHYVYAGNLPSRVGELENTRCHSCGELLIGRFGYRITDYRLTPQGTCPSCQASIPGRWAARFVGQIAAAPFLVGSGSRLTKIRNR
jgi:pyruvate formate lyase activating enzyme